MGTDIHAAIEYRDEHGWHAILFPNKYYGRYEDEPELSARVHISRDYDLFAILGNVRNGTGFAGIKTGEGFEVISDARGVPDDITTESKEVLSNEHSPTWVTLKEILEFDWRKASGHTGVVNAVEFEHWDRMKEWQPAPRSWSGDVSGGGVEHISNDAMRERIKAALEAHPNDFESALAELEKSSWYTRIDWVEGYAAAASQIWTAVLPHMLALGKDYGADNVRLVMDFDS